jgi:serine/threonine-protein kinase
VAQDTLERIKQALKDRYLVERELGRGGMATVYLGQDIRHEREVAIKVLHPDLSASIGADRFEREIKLAAKLQHPHILSLYDSGEADGLLFYVMPFVKGESLRDRIDREGQLPIDDAVQLILEVAEALGLAHSLGIVHRDIKPENVLLSNGHALVADFGIARAASEGGGAKLTQTGMALGTPVYMSPEQAMGEVVGPTADIYSMGCMLYEMLAGEPPFTGKNAHAIMARHAMENVPSIRIVRPAVPEEVEDAIFAAMAKTPADRPQTAAKFAEFFGVPIGSTATRRAALRHTASRRIPSQANLAALGTTDPDHAQPALWRRPPVIAMTALALVLAGGSTWYFLGRGTKAGRSAVRADGLDPHHIAVLYFEDQSKTRELGFLADGLTEALIGALGQVQGLSVVSKGGVNSFRASTVAADSVARALGVGTLIKGTVERDGQKIVVGVKLVDASGADFQRATIEQPATDLLAVRDSLAGKVALLIRERLGEEIKLQTRLRSTKSVKAWSLVQRAGQLRKAAEAAATKNDSTARDRDFSAADSVLASAEAEDPEWAEPITLRALVAYRRSRVSALDRDLIARWISVGLGHVGRALALDPNDADALEVKGNLQYWSYLMGLEPDPTKARALLLQAKADLEAATTKNPAQAGAWASLSHLYYSTGTAVDVNLAAKRALEADAFLDNASSILDRLFKSSYDLSQFTDAAHWCEETRRRFPTSLNAPNCELYLLTTRAREPAVARAWRLADSVGALSPAPLRQLNQLKANMMVAVVLARAGLTDSSRRVVERSKGNAELDPTRDLALLGAFAFAQAGDRTNAIEMFKLYFSANERARGRYSEDPGWQFRSLADDPRFRSLVGAK